MGASMTLFLPTGLCEAPVVCNHFGQPISPFRADWPLAQLFIDQIGPAPNSQDPPHSFL